MGCVPRREREWGKREEREKGRVRERGGGSEEGVGYREKDVRGEDKGG